MNPQDYYPLAAGMHDCYPIGADAHQGMAANSWAEPLKMPDKDLSLAMAYVIMQPRITKVYDTGNALTKGTLFPELDKPWMGKRGA